MKRVRDVIKEIPKEVQVKVKKKILPEVPVTEDWSNTVFYNSRTNNGSDGSPYIKIEERGVFSFGKIFMENINSKYVQLGFSKSANGIAFIFTDEKIVSATYILNRKGTPRVTSVPFFRHYNLDLEKIAGSYEPELLDIPNHGKLWTIDLKKKISL